METHSKHKARARERNAKISREGRDIAPIPPVEQPERKAAGERDFLCFLRTYFQHVFTLPFSPDHLTVIAKGQQSVLLGGLYAEAMPRGSGKTTLAELLCLWAVIYGHRPFIALIGSDAGHAEQMLESIKVEIETNDLLAEDFPEVCYPVTRMEGIGQRAAGQICEGDRTHIAWKQAHIILPTIKGSKASGAIIKACGITGRIRGMKHKTADGATLRPSLFVGDDLQTDESAHSPSQCQTRERTLAGAVMGLAGPGQKIAGLLPCTVIRKGDMADRFLDRTIYPDWNGERFKLIYSLPTNEKFWTEYSEIRLQALREEKGLAPATAFYVANRESMDAGAVVGWPERFNVDEASAVQHAMNLKLRDEAAFWAEYQNEPLTPDASAEELTPDMIAGRVNRIERGRLPIGATHLTAMIDVQGTLLFYAVLAVDDHFTGGVVEYGAWPEQPRPYYSLRDARPTLQDAAKGSGLEGAIYNGLTQLTVNLLGREWVREGGDTMRISRCLVDANWGQSTDTVYQFCRQSQHAAILLPSHGRYFGASATPLSHYQPRPGERAGNNWRISNLAGKRAIRHVTFDSNAWKSFAAARWRTAMGDKGAWSVFGDKPDRHRLFAEHLTAETAVKTEARGRTVDEWRLKPGRENHWLDCVCGAAVAASIGGASLLEGSGQPRRRVKLSELQRRKA